MFVMLLIFGETPVKISSHLPSSGPRQNMVLTIRETLKIRGEPKYHPQPHVRASTVNMPAEVMESRAPSSPTQLGRYCKSYFRSPSILQGTQTEPKPKPTIKTSLTPTSPGGANNPSSFRLETRIAQHRLTQPQPTIQPLLKTARSTI